ncbi:trypsin-like serine protease, partial [Paenibacillus naphthalenovorans]|uniref:trypsin-like serine protease n=1 Tax=Paenibacillus naphthalenovorans TaxID=162209 RepID=UPI003D2E927B
MSIVGKGCTGAFSARDSANNYYYVTAAHCGELNSNVTQGGSSIGLVDRRNYGGTSDALAVRISSSNASAGLYNFTPFTYKQSASEDMVGELVCHSGIESGVQCGQITNNNYATGGFGVYQEKLRIASFSAKEGDSGGPVYYGDRNIGTNVLKVFFARE